MTDSLLEDMSGDWSGIGYKIIEFSYRSKFMAEVKLLENDISKEDREYLERLLKKINEDIEEYKIYASKIKLGLIEKPTITK